MESIRRNRKTQAPPLQMYCRKRQDSGKLEPKLRKETAYRQEVFADYRD
jgi:hypothetical protein